MFIHLFILLLCFSFYIFLFSFLWRGGGLCTLFFMWTYKNYSFFCSVSYNYITIILIITALYCFCSITQKLIYNYIAMHYYFYKK